MSDKTENKAEVKAEAKTDAANVKPATPATKPAAVDFNNPKAIAEELAAIDASKEAKATATKEKKAKQPPKARIVKCPHCGQEFELPKAESTRGVVSNIALADMTPDQLKIEYRNANSVYYKTKQKGGDVTKSQARLEAVKAMMTEKGIQPTSRANVDISAADVVNLLKSGKIKIAEVEALLNKKD